MAGADELLAAARAALEAFNQALRFGIGDRADTGAQLAARFEELDDHLTATRQPPADWVPPATYWDVVIPLPADSSVRQALDAERNRYGWVYTVRENGDCSEAVIQFSIRQNAEIAHRKVTDLGCTARIEPTRNRIARPKEATQ